MQQRSSGRPALLQAMIDSFRLPDLRGKILFTLMILVIFRFVAHVPVPGVDIEALHRVFEQNQLLGMLDLFSGGAMRNLSVAAMGVYPYITASIVMQLLVPVIPRLQAISREGEAGRNRINQITHWLMVPLALLQGYGQLVLLSRPPLQAISGVGLSGPNLMPTVAMVMSMAAGTVFLVWMGELITERGIGNGISIIIFGGIVAGLPQQLGSSAITGGAAAVFMLTLMALALGFQGKFRGTDDRRELDVYRRKIFSYIARREPDLLDESKRLFPDAYAFTLDEGSGQRLPHLRWWLGVLALAILLLVDAVEGVMPQTR
ncbi:MAG: DotU family type IV/VI secretion system protein, partial [Dehalococcoidia bacterium]